MKLSLFSSAALIGIFTLFAACNRNEKNPVAPDPVVELVSTLTGIGEKPNAVQTAARGTFTGTLNKNTRVLTYTIDYTGITPTMGHLHRVTPNATDEVGPVEIPFANVTSPITGTVTLATSGRVDSLLQGYYYANLHSAAYPDGEIRGNIRVKGDVNLAASLTGGAEKPTPNASTAVGTFIGSLNPETRVLSYLIEYSGLKPTAGHLHRITPNATNGVGPPEIPITNLATSFTGTATVATEGLVDSLMNGYYYINLHTAAFPDGEIRGDIKVNHDKQK